MVKLISSGTPRPRGPGLFSRNTGSADDLTSKTNRLIQELNRAISRSRFPNQAAQDRFANRLASEVFDANSLPLKARQAFMNFVVQIVRQELAPIYTPAAPIPNNDLMVAHETGEKIRERINYFDNEADYMAPWLRQIRQILQRISRLFQGRRPRSSAFNIAVPLTTTLPDPVSTLDEIVRSLIKLARDPRDPTPRPGHQLGGAVMNNVLAISRLNFEDAQKRPYRITWPGGANLSPAELIETYLGRTPFAEYLSSQNDLAIPSDLLPEGGLITAQPGMGKHSCSSGWCSASWKIQTGPQ